MGLVQVSEKKGYKILKWAMLVIGGLLFAGGGVFILTTLGGGAVINPQKIHFTAPGLIAHQEDGYYSMDVFKKYTHIMVNTSPWGSSQKVTFEIQQGAESLEITPSIWPGESAVITLIGDQNTPYQFGRLAVILVKSGQEHEFLHVNILLPPDQVSFSFQLRNERATGQILNELSAATYFADVYHDYPTSVESKSRFVFSSKLNVYGGIVEATHFKATPQGVDHGVRLFGVNEDDIPPSGLSVGSTFTNIYIPVTILLQIIDSKVPMTFRFMISAEYLGDHISFFELKVIP